MARLELRFTCKYWLLIRYNDLFKATLCSTGQLGSLSSATYVPNHSTLHRVCGMTAINGGHAFPPLAAKSEGATHRVTNDKDKTRKCSED